MLFELITYLECMTSGDQDAVSGPDHFMTLC